jgi:hypothetical protein
VVLATPSGFGGANTTSPRQIRLSGKSLVIRKPLARPQPHLKRRTAAVDSGPGSRQGELVR